VRTDVVVIGGGHNGLVAGAYLARAGLRTVVLERRAVLGGACVTEEVWPGYRVSRAAYVAGLLRPRVIEELELPRHGLRLLRRAPSSYTPLPDGRGLLLGPDAAQNHEQIAAFSARDAERYPQYEAFLDRVARLIEPQLDAPPPNLARPSIGDLRSLARLAFGALRLRRELPEALALLLGPARPALETWFESEPLRATLATDAVIGAWAPPSAPGTGYVLFHHVMGETHGERGVWAYVEGGMGALPAAIAAAAREAGAEIRLEAPVASIDVAGGRAQGVTLATGEAIEARAVVSGADPRVTLLGLLDPSALHDDTRRAVGAIDYTSGSLKINLALDRLPAFHGDGTPRPEHHGTIHVGAQDLDALERAFAEAASGALPERPIIELTLPSSLDRTLAPEGHHVASMFVQYAPYAPADASWDTLRDAFADRCCALVDEVAPGFSASILHREVLAPPDLEREFALSGGNLFHGAMTIDRLAFLRPTPALAHYRVPDVAGLYLCGAGTHPGGGVMGAAGRNAARVVAKDLG
jgi:phytoene dehydrogenase-like protein